MTNVTKANSNFGLREKLAPSKLNKNAKNNLPPYLNQYQAVAWVRYRSAGLATDTNDWKSLASLNLSEANRPKKVGTKKDLLTALQEGTIVAQGRSASDNIPSDIIPVVWAIFPIAPLELFRQYPYTEILFRTEELVKSFANSELKFGNRGRTKGSGTMLDDRWLSEMDELLKQDKAKSPHDAAKQVVHLFEKEIRGASIDAKERRLREKYKTWPSRNFPS
ncbi:hypothetical protein [Sphingorhabdus sp.]|uniref:hypothetical protein n=1 Tax=Sphingorhabdus sp. TaxID=1902408 RepID=UPI00391B4837